jgi:hypothetical protein
MNVRRQRRLCRRASAVFVAATLCWLTALPTVVPALPTRSAQRAAKRTAVRAAASRRKTAPRVGAKETPVQTPASAVEEKPAERDAPKPDPTSAGQKVKLYYLREATKIATVLTAIAAADVSPLKGLLIASATEDEVILYGPETQRDQARRIIATLDLPRPGIHMEMWGVQLSSRKPEAMADVMPEVRAAINRTQQAVRETYAKMQELAREVIPDDRLDPDFRHALEDCQRYRSALGLERQPSLTDILLRMVAAQDPGGAAAGIANGLDEWLRTSHQRDYAEALARQGRQPFERFFRARGLLQNSRGAWTERADITTRGAFQGRIALLDFARHYSQLVHDPQGFSPYYLQQSAEALNTRLQAATDALNLDLQDLFVLPTLDTIRKIVREFKDVEYAQAGKTTVASLSGVATEVTSHSVNAFDVTPPLRLSELLTKAQSLATSAGAFIPKVKKEGAEEATDRLVGTMPLAQIVGLISAFGEERAVWRELQSGVSITVTPNVLRNMNSAELAIDLKTGDPQAGTREQGVRPLSRVSQHDVKTTVYVNALDFFDLSAFASQSTLGGGRGYVPIIGPIWQGLFGDIPVAGKLFSWQKPPQTVYSESLILTTSFVTPTAMGIALLYPTESSDDPAAGGTCPNSAAATEALITRYKDVLRGR